MKRYIEGEDRNQGTLFPEALDDYVGEDSPARVIDVFVDDLDLSSLGFERCSPALTGRPGYHPAMLLKLYIYAYLNRIHSSRRIEVEAKRNVEVMWLTQRLSPDFKTIADFRKENGEAIRLVCREFMKLCQKLKLLSNTVAIDGSKFKGNINCDQAFTDKKIKHRIEKLEKSLDDYFIELAKIDREEGKYHKTKTKRLEDKISALKKEMQRLKKLEALRMRAPDKQIALTDPDARCMKSRGSGMVGYNVQTSVDTKSHLIVSHEVINKTSDRSQLYHMAEQSKQLLKAKTLTAIGDRGYFASEDILACHNL